MHSTTDDGLIYQSVISLALASERLFICMIVPRLLARARGLVALVPTAGTREAGPGPGGPGALSIEEGNSVSASGQSKLVRLRRTSEFRCMR